MLNEDIISKHVYISGEVQGVCFRMYTEANANKLGVKGWVRNLWDGRVEAIFEGSESNVAKIITWCHTGPSYATVHAVNVNDHTLHAFTNFTIR